MAKNLNLEEDDNTVHEGNDVRRWHEADIQAGPPHVPYQRVSSIGQCNTSCSLLAGVSKAKVFRGR